jgi:hypothetical protein
VVYWWSIGSGNPRFRLFSSDCSYGPAFSSGLLLLVYYIGYYYCGGLMSCRGVAKVDWAWFGVFCCWFLISGIIMF